jgi:hypothetical protein
MVDRISSTVFLGDVMLERLRAHAWIEWTFNLAVCAQPP